MKPSHAVWGCPRQAGYGGEVWQNVVHWRRKWQTTLVFLLWESHGERSLVGYCSRVLKSPTQLKWLSTLVIYCDIIYCPKTLQLKATVIISQVSVGEESRFFTSQSPKMLQSGCLLKPPSSHDSSQEESISKLTCMEVGRFRSSLALRFFLHFFPMGKRNAVWGGLTNSCEKKRSKKQRRKGKI